VICCCLRRLPRITSTHLGAQSISRGHWLVSSRCSEVLPYTASARRQQVGTLHSLFLDIFAAACCHSGLLSWQRSTIDS
jgi:hypothetical protein